MPTLLDNLAFDAATDYSAANARLCVTACKLSYDIAPTIDCPGTSTEVCIFNRADCCVVAFKGSRELRDWIIDADFVMTYFNQVKIHAGFFSAVRSVFDRLLALLKNADRPIVITGHSLGGAEAVHLAHRLTLEGVKVHSVYTFGQPRVGDGAFVEEYDHHLGLGARTYRIVNEEDIVPRIPGLLIGYRHAGVLMFWSSFAAILGVGKIAVKPKLWAMAISDAFGIWEDWKARHALALLEDHHIERYVALFPA